MDLQEVGWGDMNLIDLAQYRDRRWTRECGEFLD